MRLDLWGIAMARPHPKLAYLLAAALAVGVIYYWHSGIRPSDGAQAPLELPATQVGLAALPLEPDLASTAAATAADRPPASASELAASASSAPPGERGFHRVEGWPGWLCHDAGPDESDWYGIANGAGTTERYSGSCASWSHAAPVETHDFARVPPLPSEPCTAATTGLAGTSTEIAVSAIDCRPSGGNAAADGDVSAKPDWLCSDVTDDEPKSLWFRIVDGPAASLILAGSCAAWARGDVPDEPSDEKD